MEAAPARSQEMAALLATVVSAGRRGVAVRRSGPLTPYAAETIVEDALHAGRGACLEITLAPTADDAEVIAVRASFAWLGARGIQVRVRRRRARHAVVRHVDGAGERDVSASRQRTARV